MTCGGGSSVARVKVDLLVSGNNSEDNLQFTLAANAFSNISLHFADNGVNILVRVGKKDSLISSMNMHFMIKFGCFYA